MYCTIFSKFGFLQRSLFSKNLIFFYKALTKVKHQRNIPHRHIQQHTYLNTSKLSMIKCFGSYKIYYINM